MPKRNSKTLAERREAGLDVVSKILSPQTAEFMDGHVDKGGFCSEISEIAIENVFAQLWARPGLDLRARSLLTLGILIGQRSRDELRVHFGIGLRNGLTVEEIEEIVYHSVGYAGFPASNIARETAAAALAAAGVIEPLPDWRDNTK